MNDLRRSLGRTLMFSAVIWCFSAATPGEVECSASVLVCVTKSDWVCIHLPDNPEGEPYIRQDACDQTSPGCVVRWWEQ